MLYEILRSHLGPKTYELLQNFWTRSDPDIPDRHKKQDKSQKHPGRTDRRTYRRTDGQTTRKHNVCALLSKTFDVVRHDVSGVKLAQLRLPPSILQWIIISFLNGGTQQDKYASFVSSFKPINVRIVFFWYQKLGRKIHQVPVSRLDCKTFLPVSNVTRRVEMHRETRKL